VVRDAALSELARADCVIADLGEKDAKVLFEIGVVHAIGKVFSY
jgi:nucleoside 2-deoxyribosyltransferase